MLFEISSIKEKSTILSNADYVQRYTMGYFLQLKTGWPDIKEAIIVA